MGGQVALYTAKNFPDRVNKLVLLNSSGYLMRPAQKYVTASYLPFFPSFLMRYFKRIGAEKTLQNVLYDHSLINQEMIDVYEKPFLKKDFYLLISTSHQAAGGRSISRTTSFNSSTYIVALGEE